jgi:hypothetical protein
MVEPNDKATLRDRRAIGGTFCNNSSNKKIIDCTLRILPVHDDTGQARTSGSSVKSTFPVNSPPVSMFSRG